MNALKNHKVLLTFIITALLMAACGAAAAPEENWDDNATFADAVEAEAPFDAPFESRVASKNGEVFQNQTITNSLDRIVIKNADLSLVVSDPTRSIQEISNMAEGMGGFIVSSNLYQVQTERGAEVPGASITIRVPSDQFSHVLNQLEAGASEVQSKNISGRDVTLEYTDLQSRLRNLDDAAEQMRIVMDEAYKTTDILLVYSQLTAITEEAEVIRGQLKYYEESAAFSAIAVYLVAEASIEPVTIGGWEPVGVVRDAVQALVSTLQVITNVLIWVTLYILPSGLALGLPLYFGGKLVKALFKRGKSKEAAPVQS